MNFNCSHQAPVSHLDLAVSAVSNLMVREPKRKIASFLLILTGWNCFLSSPWNKIEITQTEPADICPLPRKTIVNVINNVQDFSAIKHSYGSINIADRRILSNVATAEPP